MENCPRCGAPIQGVVEVVTLEGDCHQYKCTACGPVGFVGGIGVRIIGRPLRDRVRIPIKANCKICKKIFTYFKDGHTVRKLCSDRKCKNTWQSVNMRKKLSTKQRGGYKMLSIKGG